jgi:hypothetical protein
MWRHLPAALIFCAVLSSSAGYSEVANDATWSVAEGTVDGLPLVVRYRSELPDQETRETYRWLAVISWSYSQGQSGMPQKEENARMNEMEDAVEADVESRGYCVQAVTRTGNGTRVWSYYIRERDEFTVALNRALSGKPRLPIQINFYEDPSWEELVNVHKSVR